jgi:hypothetical protein
MQRAEEDDALPGQDSFIDVVCNMVGILIVLVMIVGVRASGSGGDAEAPAQDSPAARVSVLNASADELHALRDAHAEAVKIEKHIHDAAQRVVDLSLQESLVDARRQQLTLVKATVEKEIAERRAKLSSEGQRQFDVQRAIAESEIKLHRLLQDQIAAANQSATVEKVECVPTPIAKEATGEAVYVQLRHKRLAVIPVEELLAEVRRRGPDYLRQTLAHRNFAHELFGPIGGFRMRFYVAREEQDGPPPGTPRAFNAATSTEPLMGWKFLPESERVGEPVEQALLPDSQFMRALRAPGSATPTVYAWVYGDSFSELRTLKRALWKSGTPLAVNPRDDGDSIGIISRGGARPVAQ